MSETERRITGVKYEAGKSVTLRWEEWKEDTGIPTKCTKKFANEPTDDFKSALDAMCGWLLKFMEFTKGEITRTKPLLVVNQVKVKRNDELELEAQLHGYLTLRKNNRRAKMSTGWIHEEEEDTEFGISVSKICDCAIEFLDGKRLEIDDDQMNLFEDGEEEDDG